MRKLLIAALFVIAIGCFASASVAYAGDCCKPKCKVDTCKGDPCKPKCEPKCKPKCDPCKPKCDPCRPGPKHPYEECWTGFGLMCDNGCCGPVNLPCKRVCQDCETICKKIETKDPCTGCVSVEYVYETVCTEVVRPTVIPWWFQVSEGLPAENIYIDK